MKRLITAALFLLFPLITLAAVIGVNGKITAILNAVSTTATSDSFQFTDLRNVPLRAHKASIVSGVGSATVLVEVNDNLANPWITACTLAVTSAVTSDSCVSNAPWPYMRHRVSAIASAQVSSTISE